MISVPTPYSFAATLQNRCRFGHTATYAAAESNQIDKVLQFLAAGSENSSPIQRYGPQNEFASGIMFR
jgi:hypothetical protein